MKDKDNKQINNGPVLEKDKVSRKNKVFYGSLCVLLCVFWGAGNPVIKIGMFSMTPFFMLGVRFICAFLLMLLIFRKKSYHTVNKNNIKYIIIIGALSAFTYIAATFSLNLTQATIAGFLMSIAVIFTPFLSFFILKTKTDKKIFPIIILVIVGTYFLCGGGAEFTFGLGELLSTLSSVSLALVMIFTSKYIDSIGPVVMSSMQILVIGIISMVTAFIVEFPFDIEGITTAGWVSLLYQIVFCSVVTYLIQNVALKNLTAVFVSIVFCLEPLFTSLFSVLLLKEVLTIMSYVGGGLIFVGLILASLIEEKASEDLTNGQ